MFLFRLISWSVGLGLAVILAFFFVSNRAIVVWTIWPLPFETPLPAFMPGLLFLIIGLSVGFGMGWISSLKWRLLTATKVNEVERAVSGRDRARAEAKEARDKLQALEKRTQALLPPTPDQAQA